MIAEEIDDKWSISTALNNLALVYNGIGNSDAAIEHLERALLLKEELKDQAGSAKNLVNIGFQYFTKGDFDSALVYHDRGFSIDEALGNQWRIAFDLRLKGFLLNDMGKISDSLKIFEKALTIEEALGDKNGTMLAMKGIGLCHYFLQDYEKALNYLERSYAIRRELGKKTWELYHLVYLSLTQKQLSMDIDKKEIQRLLEERKGKAIRYVTNFPLYLLLGDDTYLKHAFKMVTKMADELAGDVKEKFLNYPIPKQIAETWEKVNA
jgi:tetratricopeptide (TPR) repeat protein